MKRFLTLTLVLLVLGFGLYYWVVSPVFGEPEAVEQEIGAQSDRLRADVAALCSIPGHRHVGNMEGLNAAADYILAQFSTMGYAPQEQWYTVRQGEVRNIIASYGPSDAPRWVIGAHYDACEALPGADDNASGTAGLLELARLLKEHQPELEYRIDLVAYTLEEPPYFGSPEMGSAVHANSMIEQGIDIRGMICLEMIGYFTDTPNSQEYPADFLSSIYPSTGNFIAVVGRVADPALTRAIKLDMMAASSVEVISINAPESLLGIDFSDHRNYWAHDIPAVMVTNTAFFRNKNYHQASDLPETLDYNRMAEVIEGVYWAVVNVEL